MGDLWLPVGGLDHPCLPRKTSCCLCCSGHSHSRFQQAWPCLTCKIWWDLCPRRDGWQQAEVPPKRGGDIWAEGRLHRDGRHFSPAHLGCDHLAPGFPEHWTDTQLETTVPRKVDSSGFSRIQCFPRRNLQGERAALGVRDFSVRAGTSRFSLWPGTLSGVELDKVSLQICHVGRTE